MTARKDQMTSNERMAAYFDGKEVDRLPELQILRVGRLLANRPNFFVCCYIRQLLNSGSFL